LVASSRWYLGSLLFSVAPPRARTYALSLHDALPICPRIGASRPRWGRRRRHWSLWRTGPQVGGFPRRGGRECRHVALHRLLRLRSEEHTSELQSREKLVCRLQLEKKKVGHATHAPLA